MSKVTLSLALILLSSCAHQIARETRVAGACESVAIDFDVPLRDHVTHGMKLVTTAPLSIGLTMVGGATDLTTLILTNPVTSTLLCVTAFISLTDGKAMGEDVCKHFANLTMIYPANGEKIFHATQAWRCPNLDAVSRGLRRSAACYAQRGDLPKARKQLQAILANADLFPCLSDSEISIVNGDIAGL